MKWMISKDYVDEPKSYNDLAWAEIGAHEHGDAHLQLLHENLTCSMESEVYYRQKFDEEGLPRREEAGLHVTKMILNPNEAAKSGKSTAILEVLNGGFRGMSGAAALSASGSLVGLLARIGKKVNMKRRRLDPDGDKILEAMRLTDSVNPVILTSENKSASPSQLFKPNFLQSSLKSFLGIDEILAGQKALMRGQEALVRGQEFIIQNGLRYSDVPEIATVANTNRCFFLPSSTISRIKDSVEPLKALDFFKEVLGTPTPSSLADYTS
jgi:hypothetical protein